MSTDYEDYKINQQITKILLMAQGLVTAEDGVALEAQFFGEGFFGLDGEFVGHGVVGLVEVRQEAEAVVADVAAACFVIGFVILEAPLGGQAGEADVDGGQVRVAAAGHATAAAHAVVEESDVDMGTAPFGFAGLEEDVEGIAMNVRLFFFQQPLAFYSFLIFFFFLRYFLRPGFFVDEYLSGVGINLFES